MTTEEEYNDEYSRMYKEFIYFLGKVEERREFLLEKGTDPGKDSHVDLWYSRVDYLMGKLLRANFIETAL